MSINPSDAVSRPALLARVAPEVRVFAAAFVLYVLTVLIAAGAVGRLNALQPFIYTATMGSVVVVSALIWLVGYLLRVVFRVRPERPLIWAIADLRERARVGERLRIALPLIAMLLPFFGLFTSMKALIPVFHPYDWDSTLHHWDVALFGEEPWRLLAGIYRFPWAVWLLNFAYNLWFPLMYFLLLWQLFTLANRQLRLQFLLAFMASWALIGNGLATWLSSAGPCFYGHVVPGADPYALQMAQLQAVNAQVPVWALPVQQMLWHAYAGNQVGLGSGISAMPSMHVSDTLLFALLGWRRHRKLGLLLFAYLAVILFGSVLLAWHYAVDGLVALVGSSLIWWGAGVVSRRFCGDSMFNGEPLACTGARCSVASRK